MYSMGLLISHKSGEKRRAILPNEVRNLVNANQMYFEEGYGATVGIADAEYVAAGAHVVPRNEALKCDIITDVKLGDADYLDELDDGKILLGWAHAAQGVNFTNICIRKKFTVIAWEEIFENGRYIFYRNREVAGEAGVMQAFLHYGKMPYDSKVAIIGNGQTAKGALRVLHGLGASVDVYPRKLEKLFMQKKYDYDVIVNCVMWDITRKDRLIYKEDLLKMKPGTMIIDISCDPHLEIETTHATTIDDPVYVVDGIIHYAVDNTPAMFPITVTKILSEENAKIMDDIIEWNLPKAIKDAIVLDKGIIVSESVRRFREMNGYPC